MNQQNSTKVRLLNTDKLDTRYLKIDNENTVLNLKDSLSSINEFSTGISVGIENSSFLSNYQNAITTQINTLQNSVIIGKNLQLNLSQTNNLFETVIAPMSSVIAGTGLVATNTDRLYDVGLVNKSIFENTQKISELCLNVVKDQQATISSNLSGVVQTKNYLKIPDSIISSQVIGDGVNTLLRSLSTYPTEIKLPTLDNIHATSKVTEAELSDHQAKLDKLLHKIDPLLVEYRLGCWEAFRKKGKDYIGQSSSSMRRLVDSLLRILAPMGEVTSTQYFKNSPLSAKDKNGKPTRKTRIFHILKYKKAEHIKRLIVGFTEAYDNLTAWDHTPSIKRDTFVQGVFVVIEGYLTSLLSESE